MPKGGARSGSGPKPALDVMEELATGAEFDRRLGAEQKRREDAALAALQASTEYGRLIEEVLSVPVDERDAWLASYEAEDHADDVEGALRGRQGIDLTSEEAATRVSTITVPRPYALRAKIESEVADWASTQFGRRVSIRTVQTCRAKYRKFKKRLQQDTDL